MPLEKSPKPIDGLCPGCLFQSPDIESTLSESDSEDAWCLTLNFAPGIKSTTSHAADWFAQLVVDTTDIARLMEQGFHWTEANVDKGAGYFELCAEELPLEVEELGWTCRRSYSLSDLDENPLWTATLEVFASDPRTLAQFRVSNLWIDDIREANVKDFMDRLVYSFDALDSSKNMNAVFDDMPLEGWWPWPRKEVEQDTPMPTPSEQDESWYEFS